MKIIGEANYKQVEKNTIIEGASQQVNAAQTPIILKHKLKGRVLNLVYSKKSQVNESRQKIMMEKGKFLAKIRFFNKQNKKYVLMGKIDGFIDSNLIDPNLNEK